MTTVLILGTLAGQVDAIAALQRRGIVVHACGHVAQGPGVEAADAFHVADIADPSAVEKVAKDSGADWVYSVGSDLAMPTIAQVSENLGLPRFHSPELTDVLRHKEKLRAHLDSAGLSPVRTQVVTPEHGAEGWTHFPAIVKPVDGQGQRGITIIQSAAEMAGAAAIAMAESRSGDAIVEEFLEGPEVSVHVMVVDREIVFYLPSDRHVWDGPLVGIPQAHSLPSTLGKEQDYVALRELVEKCVNSLEVTHGPLYFQVILTPHGPRIVEIGSRLDGCHLWRLIELSTGFRFLDAVLGRLMGEPWPDSPVTPAADPMTLDFFLESPDLEMTAQLLSEMPKDDAVFVELHVSEGEYPRRTNPVVSRVGYQVYRDN